MSSIMRRRSGEIFSDESFMVLLRLRYEAECLTSQLTKQNLKGQLSTDANRTHPYRASGLVPRPQPDGRHRLLCGNYCRDGPNRLVGANVTTKSTKYGAKATAN